MDMYTDSEWVAVRKIDTAIIACDIGTFTASASGATEGNDVSIDSSDGDGDC